MKTNRKNDTITIELTIEQAALLAANIAASREDAMVELYERLLGSPAWKHKHKPESAHAGVIDVATYNRVLENHGL
ncbi:MAG: hypothetical protein ACXVCJ_26315 [Polyangiales bacterium]